MRTVLLTILLLGVLASPAAARPYPEVIPLPDGFQPEGIATGRGNQFFVGSIGTGAIFAGDLRTGRGEVLVEGRGGASAIGLEVDRRNRLFVAGGATGKAFVYSARSGRALAEYELTTGSTFVNDGTVTRRAAYFTDSQQQQLYVLDLGPGGRLPERARTLPLTGDLAYDDDPATFELNGIAATPSGRTLFAVQSRTGALFAIDPRTGDTDEVELAGGTLERGDGILLRGRTLHVVQNFLNKIAVVRLDGRLAEGEIVRVLRDEDFRIPTTIARKGGRLWAVNARFDTPPGPDTEYEVVRVDRRPR